MSFIKQVTDFQVHRTGCVWKTPFINPVTYTSAQQVVAIQKYYSSQRHDSHTIIHVPQASDTISIFH